MAILDFMPKFAPWYTKQLLKKEDEPATDPSTGFFGDVFNFIDDAFTWPANPEPVEPDWGGASLGAGFGEQAPAYEPYIEPDYSGMGDPFGMADPFTEEDWVSAPSTPTSFTGPVFGGMFGSAAPYAPPPPPSGIGDAIGGSLGSGEGWGFDLIDEPTQSWAGYAPPPPTSFAGGIAGGMFGSEPTPTSYPDISAQWQDTDWVSAPPRESFGDNFGMDFRGRLDASLGDRDPWADVQNWEGVPAPSADTSEWNQLAGVPGNGIGSAIGGAFSDFGADVGARLQEPIEFEEFTPWGGEWAGGLIGAGVATPEYNLRNDWSMFGNSDQGLGMMPQGWDQMSPKERGEYVYFSGLRGDDYLSENDYANMPVDLKQKIGYTDSRIEGGISNGFSSLWDTIGAPVMKVGNAALNIVGDAAVDPFFDPLDSTGNILSPLQKDFWSKGPGLNINFGGDPSNVDWSLPLEDVVSDAQTADNPWDFVESQDEEFNQRPLLQQLAIGMVTPGSGIYKNVEGAPKWLRAFDSAIDFAQGGAAFDNIGTLPSVSPGVRSFANDAAVGGVAGGLTEAVFDPSYTNEFGEEYDLNMLESILAGGLGWGGVRAAARTGTVPFGGGLEDVTRNLPDIPEVRGTSRWGLPNQKKGDPGVLIEWADPLDKALYQATSSGTAKTKPAVIAMLKENGFTDADIAEGGARVRQAIRDSVSELQPRQGETIFIDPVARSVSDELSTVPPSVTNPVDEIIESSTVPPIAPKTLEELQEEVRLSDPDAAAAMFSPGAVTPSTAVADGAVDLPAVGSGMPDKFSTGNTTWEKRADGSWVMRDINSPVAGTRVRTQADAEARWTAMQPPVDAAVTPPVVTGAPLVDKVVAHIDLIKSAREMDAGAEKAALNQWQTAVTRESQARLGNVRGLEEAAKQISNVRMATFAPGAVRLTSDEATLVLETALDKARKMGYGEPGDYAVRRAVNSLRDGTNAAPSELNLLRALLTDTPYDKATVDAIDSVVTPPPAVLGGATEPVIPGTVTTADGVVMKAPPTPKAPKGIDPADIAPEVTPQPQIIRRQNAAKRPPAVDPNDPLKGQVFKPSGVERTAFPQSEAAVQPSLDVGPVDPLRGKTPGTAPESSMFPDTVERPVQRAVLESVPKKHEPRINEWVDEMRQKTSRMSVKERDNFLDKQQVKLAKELRAGDEPAAGSIAATARDNVGKLAQEDREFANNAVRTAWVEDWRRRYVPVLDKIELDEMISKTARGRGRISNKMGDALTEYSDRLLLGLKNNGLSEDEAMATVQDEMSRYLNNRGADLVLKGDPDGLLRGTYTAVHTGPFKPQTPAGILPVPKGTGDVPKALQITSDVAMEIKNSKFGLTDMAGIFANGALAVLRNPHSLSTYYLARIAEIAGAPVDVRKWLDFAENAGLLATKQTDQMDPGAGTVISRAGKMMGGGKLEPVGDVLKTIDKGPQMINKALETAQYDLVLNQALRKPAYAGTMAILELLSKIPVFGKYIDPYDPRVQEGVARLVNGTTSAARPARDNVRRSIEASGPTSARFTRAQLDVIGMATRLFALKNVPPGERAAIGMMILSTAGALGAAKLVVGENLNLNWDEPDEFGRLRIPDGRGGNLLLNLQPNTQVMKALHQSADAISDYIEGETDPRAVQQKLSDAWVRLAMSRLGPSGTTILNSTGVGFDPKTNSWNYPGIPGVFEGSGDGWGSTMGTGEKALRLFPFLPVGAVDYTADKLSGEEAGALSRLINFFGAGSFEENEITTILREEYGVDNWEEFEALNPSDYINRRQKLFDEHDDLYENDSAVSGYQELKKESSEDFMRGAVGSTVKKWRDEQKQKANETTGAWNELGIEAKERPEKDGSAQWLYDYNQTFARSKEDPENPLSDLDFELLGKEQAAFWEKHPDPEVRKQLLAYQIGKAPTKADKEWAKSMARLNGFDPETGERLTYPGTDKPLPNYFEMDRYVWREVPNDESKEFHALFDRWKLKQSPRVRELGTDKLIELYIQTDPEAATRVNGKAWTPTAIKDVQYYDKPSKEDPIFSEYKQIMLPDLLWFKPEQYWDNIEAALEEKYGKE